MQLVDLLMRLLFRYYFGPYIKEHNSIENNDKLFIFELKYLWVVNSLTMLCLLCKLIKITKYIQKIKKIPEGYKND